MDRSKGYALMFLLGAFVAGGALGFTADRVMEKRGHERGPRAYRQRMAQELKLTPQQKASVGATGAVTRTVARPTGTFHWSPMAFQ